MLSAEQPEEHATLWRAHQGEAQRCQLRRREASLGLSEASFNAGTTSLEFLEHVAGDDRAMPNQCSKEAERCRPEAFQVSIGALDCRFREPRPNTLLYDWELGGSVGGWGGSSVSPEDPLG